MSLYTVEELKELIKAVDNSSLLKFEVKNDNGQKITMSKEVNVVYAQNTAPMQTVAPTSTVTFENTTAPTQSVSQNDITIKSPMVGVFYQAPSPDASPYVSVGQSVNKGDVVCIVEAMKLMNEVVATQSGVIDEILVSNGDVVEFDQPLFKIK